MIHVYYATNPLVSEIASSFSNQVICPEPSLHQALAIHSPLTFVGR